MHVSSVATLVRDEYPGAQEPLQVALHFCVALGGRGHAKSFFCSSQHGGEGQFSIWSKLSAGSTALRWLLPRSSSLRADSCFSG